MDSLADAGALPADDARPADRAAASRIPRTAALALVELLDRDGQPRQSLAVHAWPLRIGRALDNDLVLGDPHVAAHHLTITRDDDAGLTLTLADTRNGALLGRKRLHSGESVRLAEDGEQPIALTLGRSHMRLRLPGHALAPELALAPTVSFARRALPMLVAALLLIAGTLFNTWLDTDPENLGRAIGNAALTSLVGAAIWCTAWALMSKTFTRQAQLGWHVRVFLYASLALLVVAAVPPLLAFAFSWPAVTDFDFVGTIVVIAAALYFHLLAVEPAKQRLLKWAALGFAVAGVLLTLWFNLQRRDQLGDELYMSHLLPPSLRVAKPISTNALVDSLSALRPTLDQKAKEPAHGDEGRSEDE